MNIITHYIYFKSHEWILMTFAGHVQNVKEETINFRSYMCSFVYRSFFVFHANSRLYACSYMKISSHIRHKQREELVTLCCPFICLFVFFYKNKMKKRKVFDYFTSLLLQPISALTAHNDC